MSVDYYDDLGVAPDASPAEITARFRALARRLHPDARPVSPEAAEGFVRVSTAYRVLGDRERRREYDRARTAARATAPTTPESRWRLTRRGARGAVIGGVACLVFGVLATVLVVALQRHDAALRREGVETTAVVALNAAGDRRLEFVVDGEIVQAPEPLKSGLGKPAVGSEVEIRYDPDDPTTVIANESQLARDITLWIVAIKLLVVGAAFVVFGALRLRRD
jgi:hypothetical protein